MFFDRFSDSTLRGVLTFASPGSRVFVFYLFTAFLLAVGSFIYFRYLAEADRRPETIERGLIGYIFDRSIFWHRSARQDYLYFLINTALYGGIISQALVGMHVMTDVFEAGFEAVLGPRGAPLFEASPSAAVAWTILWVVVIDFAVFLAHYLQHRWPVLWQFHQVHHSAEVLTPMTFFRMHPVDLITNTLMTAALGSFAVASYHYFADHDPRPYQIMSINIVLFVFYVVGYNLRHSHIWLSYPPWLSYIFISPAQHQTHHSVDARHFDRNFGLIFSVWDWMFGTLYVPRGYEKLSFGLSRANPNPFNSVAEIYMHPFRNAWRIVRGSQTSVPLRPVLLAALAIFGGIAADQLLIRDVRAGGYVTPSVHLEELTWTEIDRALATGYDTVIIPTGGTEQNGSHVVLGKHNYIVRYTAGEIAQRLGQTLVAPVITYVPEGTPGAEPKGHMRFAGTLTVSDRVFEEIVLAAVESYATHGFTRIYLLGDSRGNQAPQARVAERMNGQGGLTVVQLGEYYAENGQVDWLRERGFTDAQIGGHAGIRDTSELMAVHAEGVRDDPLPRPAGAEPDANGDPSLASTEIGEAMLELKIEAALRQIATIEPAPTN